MVFNMLSNVSEIRSKFSVTQIITALKDFAFIHKKVYQDALDVYREDVKKKIADLVHKQSHDFTTFQVDLNLGLVAPVNCEKQYNQLIELFSRVEATEIELDFGEANRIFNNEWDWAESASLSNSFYASRKR